MATKKTSAKKSPSTAAKKSPSSVAKKSVSSASSASNAIDQQLARYREMRDFKITSEPSGSAKSTPKKSSAATLPFVIQKHAASHLHYDFRLGWNGVLKSWAVAKGPSYVTADKRLAVQVEDHPMEYGGFEGIIPQGQYGGGTVMLWDEGTWEPQPAHPNVDESLRTGSLKFTLHGTKLKGNWALVRMGGRAANERKPNWLLIKEHDAYEQPATATPITEAEPNSVITNRSLEQIAAVEDHIWNSKDTAGTGRAWHRNDKPPAPKPSAKKSTPPAAKPAAADVKKKPGNKSAQQITPPSTTPKESLPAFIPPQLATQSTEPISSPGWLHELKLDGYRIQARKQGASVQLLTRTGLDWTHRMQTIAEQIAALPAQSLLLDGELVVLADNGTTSFADLQAAFQDGIRKPLTYFVFDILHLDGHNLRGLPLIERKAILARLLITAGEFVRLSEHLETDGAAIFHKACELEAEGIISKRAAGKYTSGRTTDWLKVKCIREQEFVIGGFTLPSKGHAGMQGIGALLLGYYNDSGQLIYAGRTGTGFTQKTHAAIRTQLDKLRQPSTPFASPPAEARKDAIWIKPELVAQVRFATWTADNLVRQASFKGIREDKPAKEVRKETAAAINPKPVPKQPGIRPTASHTATKPLAAKTSAQQSIPAKSSSSHPALAKKSAAKSSLQTAPVRLTHPTKILDPLSELTKQQLADYYWAIAPHMLPFIAHRPLSLVRCPEGSSQPCFFQKHVNHMLPPGIESVPVPDKKTGKPEDYITLSTPEALAGLAQMGVLEVHPWGSRNDDLEHPDSIIIDLDPDEAIAWRTLADAALEVRKRLKKLNLESFLKSTGGKGLHIVVPIQPEHDWPTVKDFAHNFVRQLERDTPSLYLTTMTKSQRKNRIYLDYLRNERGATAVAIFSPRARPGCPVSVPLSWTELKLPARPDCTVANFTEWLPRLKRNPWKQYASTHQRLDPSLIAKK